MGSFPGGYEGPNAESTYDPIDPCVIGDVPSVQVMFARPDGMRVMWDESGTGAFLWHASGDSSADEFSIGWVVSLEINAHSRT